MEMDDRTKEIFEMMESNTLGYKDTFRFKCRACGKCCRNREDILLPPYDIYRISKYLRLSPEEMISKYCESYIGSTSRFPVVRILPRGSGRVCPFLADKLCLAQKAKPGVCALYPLGRAIKRTPDGQTDGVIYFYQPTNCSVKKVQIVEDWLNQFDLRSSEAPFLEWSRFISDLHQPVQNLLEKLGHDAMQRIWSFIFATVYLSYDMAKAFDVQFKCNLDHCRVQLYVVIDMVERPGGQNNMPNEKLLTEITRVLWKG